MKEIITSFSTNIKAVALCKNKNIILMYNKKLSPKEREELKQQLIILLKKDCNKVYSL